MGFPFGLHAAGQVATEAEARLAQSRRRSRGASGGSGDGAAGGGDGGGHSDNDGSSDGSGDRDGGRRQQAQHRVDLNYSLMDERAQEIQEVHTAVSEINEMMRDLAGLVEAQEKDVGACVRGGRRQSPPDSAPPPPADDIEINVHEGLEKTKGGVKELEAAEEHQNRSRSKVVPPRLCVCECVGRL